MIDAALPADTARLTPTPLWIVLFLTAGILFAYMLFLADSGERAKSQAMLMGSAVTMVVATLLAIHALDNPYRAGIGSIQPVAMERALRILSEERAVVKDRAPEPCDENGVPTS